MADKLSFKDVAAKILESAEEPLTAQEIVDLAMQDGLLMTDGKTPEATMAAQLYIDIKNPKTKFKKVGRGKFTLSERTDSSASPLVLIEQQNRLVQNALLERLYEMDPFEFEFLIADLLKEIGYEQVEMTKRSGDKGIDVTANLTMDGVTNVKTVIQAKRYKKGNNIAGKIIAQLRGSAEVDQRGLVITTSDFTSDAIKEAKAQNKMPVSLINGEKLVSLLIKYEVGVKKDTVDVFSIDLDYFENEIDSTKYGQETSKGRSVWPLPGGTDSYVESLFDFLAAVSQGGHSKDYYISWFINSYENVNSEKSANSYTNVPRNMGLTEMNDGKIVLTEAGRRILESRDKEDLYEVISENILAFEEITEFLRTSGEAQTEQSILQYLRENLDIEWKTYAQVTYRLLWLLNLGKIKRSEDGYVIV
ncbi:MAG: restriction endonuclease [Propionibacteriaceae bacterium]